MSTVKLSKKPIGKRPQWLIFTDDDQAEQALLSSFVSSVLVVQLQPDEFGLVIETAGGTKILAPGMSVAQANRASNHVKYALSLAMEGKGDVLSINKVIAAAKEAIKAPLVELAQ